MNLFAGKAIVIPPLLTIQVQMSTVCSTWNIPYLDLSDVSNPEDIPRKLLELDPKIIIASIEDINKEEIQAKLQKVDVRYVAIDECQV